MGYQPLDKRDQPGIAPVKSGRVGCANSTSSAMLFDVSDQRLKRAEVRRLLRLDLEVELLFARRQNVEMRQRIPPRGAPKARAFIQLSQREPKQCCDDTADSVSFGFGHGRRWS
jgi:hypothetical protein